MQHEIARYGIGQLIHHKLFDYRGVVVDVDAEFQRSDEWYMLMARTKPAKNQPWYLILVDNTDYMTYVAEQNLEMDRSGEPITHPDIKAFFGNLNNGCYETRRPSN